MEIRFQNNTKERRLWIFGVLQIRRDFAFLKISSSTKCVAHAIINTVILTVAFV